LSVVYAKELQNKGQEPLGLLRATAVAVGAFVGVLSALQLLVVGRVAEAG
jgi:hypothetical protein